MTSTDKTLQGGGPQNEPSGGIDARTAVGSAGYLAAAQVTRLVLTTLSTVLIARLLQPEDYGVLAMAAPVVGFIVMFQDFGLSAAAIQARLLSSVQSSSLFWLNIFASVVLATVLLLLAPFVAWFYNDVRGGYITAASSVMMIIAGAGIQHTALMNRDMKFRLLSVIDVGSSALTFVVSLILAFALRSYWALFFGSLAGTLFQTFMAWWKSNFLPNRRPSFAGAADLIRFGGHLTGFNIFNFFVRNADNVLIAKVAGPVQLGLYDRSYKLMMLPIQSVNTPLSRLLLPLLSRLRQEPERYRRTFLIAARGMMLATVPGIAIATALSDQLMPFLLGHDWAAAGPIFFWLGLTGLIQPVANLSGVLYLTSDRSKLMMWWGIVSAVITLIAFAVAIPWGAVGIAFSLFLSAAARLPLIMYLAARGVSVSQGDLWRAQLEPLIGCGLAAALALWLSDHVSLLSNLIISLPSAYALSSLSSCISKDGRITTFKIFDLIIVQMRRIQASCLNVSPK